MAPTLTVLYPLTLAGLLHHILTSQVNTGPTTLIVCSGRDTFLQDLSVSLQHDSQDDAKGLDGLIAPTLHNLFITRHVQVAFCASVQALLAYLSAYGRPGVTSTGLAEGMGRLVLVNPLALHAPTPSFSAQGLSRTFATAVDTALRNGIDLCVVECQGRRKHRRAHEQDEDMENEAEEDRTEAEKDPWEQEVSMLNVSARRFGSGSGDGAWAGRTVKAKRAAGRWFHFQKLEDAQMHGDAG